MKVQAVCPVCGARVPRVWFTWRKFRPCRRCSTPIKANKRRDSRFSHTIGAVGPPMFGLAGALVGVTADGRGGAVVGAAVGWFIIGIPATLAASYWLFPYFVPFEEREASALCRVCGYDLRATPDRCPECGTVPQGPFQDPEPGPPGRR